MCNARLFECADGSKDIFTSRPSDQGYCIVVSCRFLGWLVLHPARRLDRRVNVVMIGNSILSVAVFVDLLDNVCFLFISCSGFCKIDGSGACICIECIYAEASGVPQSDRSSATWRRGSVLRMKLLSVI